MGADITKPADVCMRVCTGVCMRSHPGVSSGSQGLVSRISNSPRYQEQLTEKRLRVDRNPPDTPSGGFRRSYHGQ